MNNTNSFIMRDQVGDVVKGLMEDDPGIPLIRYLGQISIILLSIVTFRFILPH